MRALVTGAAGLIGAHIVRALVGAGHEVRCLVRQTSRRGSLDGLPVTWVVVDLLDAGTGLDVACADCDMVFHTAAHYAYGGVNSVEQRRTAVVGTEALLRACARQGVRSVVVTSSSVVFGYRDDAVGISEAAVLASGDGEPSYVAAKIAQHRHSLRMAEVLGLDVRLACPTMTIGPTGSRLGPSNGMIAAYLVDPFGCTFSGGCNIVSARDVAAGPSAHRRPRHCGRKLSARRGEPHLAAGPRHDRRTGRCRCATSGAQPCSFVPGGHRRGNSRSHVGTTRSVHSRAGRHGRPILLVFAHQGG